MVNETLAGVLFEISNIQKNLAIWAILLKTWPILVLVK
jgi:hypothetical protein